jgi:hypothetical protein
VGIDARHLENLVQRQMFVDPTGGIFNKRIMLQFFQMAQQSELDEKQRAEVFDLLHVIALKFVSIWTHDQRYEKRQNELVAACEANPSDRRENKPVRFESAQDLYIELDGFLVQCKSVLDHMCNILHYSMGITFNSLTTFGDNGNKIIKILKCNAPSNGKRAAKELVRFIGDNQEWLTLMIDARDRMNHFAKGGLPIMGFGVACIIEKDGTKKTHVPQMNDKQSVKEVMTMLLDNVLHFVEYFLGITICVRMPGWGVKWQNSDDPMKPRWEVMHEMIIDQMVKAGRIDPKNIR